MTRSSPENLEGVLDRLLGETEGEEEVAVADVLDAFEDRLPGPVLCVPALVLITPLGGIPLLPTIVGRLLASIAGQRLVGMRRPWIPEQLCRRSVERDRVRSAFDRARPRARRVDRVLAPRLVVLVTGPMSIVVAASVAVLAALMPPLEAVPFATAAPALGCCCSASPSRHETARSGSPVGWLARQR